MSYFLQKVGITEKKCRVARSLVRLCSLLIASVFFVESRASSVLPPVPLEGMAVKYICKSGKNSAERTVFFWSKAKNETLVFRGSWSNHEGMFNGKMEDGLANSWEYLANIAGYWGVNRSLFIITLKNGNLKGIARFKEGVYSGNLTVQHMMQTYNAKIRVEVGKSERISTQIGSQKVIPILSTLTNLEGAGKTLILKGNYSPSLRVFTNQTVIAPETSRFLSYECGIKALKLESSRSVIPQRFQFQWPISKAAGWPKGKPPGKYKFTCTGYAPSYAFRMKENEKNYVSIESMSSIHDGLISGTPTQIYLGMANGIPEFQSKRNLKVERQIMLSDRKSLTGVFGPGFLRGKLSESFSGTNTQQKGLFFTTISPLYRPFEKANFEKVKSQFDWDIAKYQEVLKAKITATKIRTLLSFDNREYYREFIYSPEMKAPLALKYWERVLGKEKEISCTHERPLEQ